MIGVPVTGQTIIVIRKKPYFKVLCPLASSKFYGRFAAIFSSKFSRFTTLLLIATILGAAGLQVVASYEKTLHEEREIFLKDLARRQANAIEVQIYASIAATQHAMAA